MKTTAIAHANIALIKYWGKRNSALNLPATGSISITLEALSTRTTIRPAEEDQLILNGAPASLKELQRTSRFLDLLRKMAGQDMCLRIESANNFPTSAGLASSASGFAALTLAAGTTLGLQLSGRKLSELSRKGSGSAARSVYGGFVEMHHGREEDGSDSVAEPLFAANHWPLETLILITSKMPKPIGSTEGMNLTRDTSPYYSPWVQEAEKDLSAMRSAIATRDFEQVAALSEFSCLKMHGLAMSANPGILYWNATTVSLIHEVRRLRAGGLPVFFTIDAGPQVKVICEPGSAARAEAIFRNAPGVEDIIHSTLGPDARIEA